MYDMKPVTVCILTYNSRDSILRCIRSVLQQTYRDFDLIVQDNRSTDGTAQYVASCFPEIFLTSNSENLGFARAHNQIINQCNSKYYLPLNPDVQLEPNYLENLIRVMQGNIRVGICAGKLYFMGVGGEKSNLLYSTGHLLTKSRSPTNRGYKKIDLGQYDKEESVFAANGSAPLYRKEMLDDIAIDGEYFCEDFFMYGEDHDLGWRARLKGWECVYTPLAVGYHEGFGSGGIRSFFIQTEFTRNRYLTLLRNDRVGDFLLDLPFIFLYELILQGSFLLRTPKRLIAHWVGFIRALMSISKTLKARSQIQKNRTTSPDVIRSFFVNQLW